MPEFIQIKEKLIINVDMVCAVEIIEDELTHKDVLQIGLNNGEVLRLFLEDTTSVWNWFRARARRRCEDGSRKPRYKTANEPNVFDWLGIGE